MNYIKYILISLMIFSTDSLACGDNQNAIIQGPFKTNIFNNGTICFQRTNDKRNIDFILNKITNNKFNDILVDRYDYSDGPVDLLSVFFFPVNKKNNIFVILRWGVNYGDNPSYKYYYEVRAYERVNDKLIANKLLGTDPELSGYQTIKSGVVYNYGLDSAGKVKEYIKMKYQ